MLKRSVGGDASIFALEQHFSSWPCDYIHTNEKSSVGEGGPSEHQGIKMKEIFTSWPLASYERISPKETRTKVKSLLHLTTTDICSLLSSCTNSPATSNPSQFPHPQPHDHPQKQDHTEKRLTIHTEARQEKAELGQIAVGFLGKISQGPEQNREKAEIQNIKPQEVSGFYHGVLVNPQQLAASSSGPPGRSSRSRERATLGRFMAVFLKRPAEEKEEAERAVEEEYSLSRNPYLSDVSRVKELLYRVLPMAFLQYTFSEKMWEINDRHQYESSPSKSKPPFGGKLLWKGNEHLQGINNQLPPVSAHTSPPPTRHAYSVPPDSGSSPDLPLHPHTQSQLQLSPACGPGSLNCSYYSKLSPSPSTFPFLLSFDENNEESEEHKVEKEKVKWDP
ncbi:hypothetical protein MJT46_013813 [Ovis ammon polii x Ovis aries]|nr:hypothetical protein MJT46_013813 [Ovis ammon polii x Ovis aries]